MSDPELKTSPTPSAKTPEPTPPKKFELGASDEAKRIKALADLEKSGVHHKPVSSPTPGSTPFGKSTALPEIKAVPR